MLEKALQVAELHLLGVYHVSLLLHNVSIGNILSPHGRPCREVERGEISSVLQQQTARKIIFNVDNLALARGMQPRVRKDSECTPLCLFCRSAMLMVDVLFDRSGRK